MGKAEKIKSLSNLTMILQMEALMKSMGPRIVIGNQLYIGRTIGNTVKPEEYEDNYDFLEADEFNRTRLNIWKDSKAKHQGKNIFLLSKCPFNGAEKDWKIMFEEMPKWQEDVIEQAKGDGIFGVRMFCTLCQTFRTTVGKRMKVGGKDVELLQLGSKNESGSRIFHEENIIKIGLKKEDVEDLLKEGQCAYCVHVNDEEKGEIAFKITQGLEEEKKKEEEEKDKKNE